VMWTLLDGQDAARLPTLAPVARLQPEHS